MTMKFKAGMGALLAIAAFTVAQWASAADVTGTWIMAVETGAGSGSPTFILVQTGRSAFRQLQRSTGRGASDRHGQGR